MPGRFTLYAFRYKKGNKYNKRIKRKYKIKMGRLAKSAELCLFEYPPGAESPSFEIDAEGTLLIFGYKTMLAEKVIKAAKRFDLKLSGYAVLGTYKQAAARVNAEFLEYLTLNNFDFSRTIVLEHKKTQ
jgi:hypothetical protein